MLNDKLQAIELTGIAIYDKMTLDIQTVQGSTNSIELTLLSLKFDVDA